VLKQAAVLTFDYQDRQYCLLIKKKKKFAFDSCFYLTNLKNKKWTTP